MLGESFFQKLTYWTVLGSNYTKADTETRSRFALNHIEIENIYIKARNKGLRDLFILSTCNRIEFYGCAPLEFIWELIRKEMDLDTQKMTDHFYTYTDVAAIRHFFRVTAGLDSQIIGDYEIVGQVRKALQISRDFGLVGTWMDRISNYAFQASKEIKTKTNLSNGKYSVSFAAAELINSHQNGMSFKNVLIVGTGEIGKAMARNLSEYFPQCQISLTNRTESNAQSLALELNAKILPFDQFKHQLSEFDAIITTAESDSYLVNVKDIPNNGSRLYLDLSIPQVIDPQIKYLVGVNHYSVDEISSFHNELMKQRHLEIPKAELIIEDFIGKLMEWQNIFKHSSIIFSYKEKMGRIIHNGDNPVAKIEKTFFGLIQQIKSEGYRGCSIIQAMNEIISLEK